MVVNTTLGFQAFPLRDWVSVRVHLFFFEEFNFFALLRWGTSDQIGGNFPHATPRGVSSIARFVLDGSQPIKGVRRPDLPSCLLDHPVPDSHDGLSTCPVLAGHSSHG
jgi:hypothetical protein